LNIIQIGVEESPLVPTILSFCKIYWLTKKVICSSCKSCL